MRCMISGRDTRAPKNDLCFRCYVISRAIRLEPDFPYSGHSIGLKDLNTASKVSPFMLKAFVTDLQLDKNDPWHERTSPWSFNGLGRWLSDWGEELCSPLLYTFHLMNLNSVHHLTVTAIWLTLSCLPIFAIKGASIWNDVWFSFRSSSSAQCC